MCRLLRVFLFLLLASAGTTVMAQTSVKDTTGKKTVEWETYGMPGFVLHTYFPDLHDSLGYFKGLSVEYLIAAWIHKNENKGPSHGRVYAKVNFMSSSKKGINDIFYMALGLDLSLERNPVRDIFIPYFGIELGSMHQKQFGNVFAITPTFGVHIYSSQNIFINLTGGYVYPSVALEDLRGYTAQLGVNFSFW